MSWISSTETECVSQIRNARVNFVSVGGTTSRRLNDCFGAYLRLLAAMADLASSPGRLHPPLPSGPALEALEAYKRRDGAKGLLFPDANFLRIS